MTTDNVLVHKKVILNFSRDTVDQAIVYRLVKDFDLVPNIIKANVSPDMEGFLLLDLAGKEDDYRRALDFLREQGLKVKSLIEHVIRDEDSCTQCGLCTGVCPSGALYLERPEQRVCFNGEKCVVCNICIQACPMHAMKLDV